MYVYDDYDHDMVSVIDDDIDVDIVDIVHVIHAHVVMLFMLLMLFMFFFFYYFYFYYYYFFHTDQYDSLPPFSRPPPTHPLAPATSKASS
mgnify:CR=1 FL=1